MDGSGLVVGGLETDGAFDGRGLLEGGLEIEGELLGNDDG